MAATVSEAAEGLRERLATIVGLRTYEYLADSFQPPAAMVNIDNVDYHQAFAGGDPVYTFTVTLFVARAEERTAQRKLDDYLSYSGDKSVREAIENDTTLGGRIETCVVTSGGNIAALQVNEATYLSIEFTVIVHP
jgi:hypothetical protein